MSTTEVEFMSLEYVNNVTSTIEGFTFEPTTVAYVHSLSQAIYDVMRDVDDVDAIKQWLPSALPEAIVNELLELTKEATNALAVKDAVMTKLVQSLLVCGATLSGSLGDPNVLPWDVKKGLTNDPLNSLYQMQDDKLPLTITFKGHSASHELSLPFVVGVSSFSLSSGTDFNITLFGQVLSNDYLLRENSRFKYTETKVSKFVLGFNEETQITFDEEEVLQGFNTGAYWKDDDSKKYWQNLWTLEVEGEETKLVDATF